MKTALKTMKTADRGGTWGPLIHFKACPRCRGDLEVARDAYGDYLHCLQCGYIQELPALPIQEGKARPSAKAL